jgi:hypothetical protein
MRERGDAKVGWAALGELGVALGTTSTAGGRGLLSCAAVVRFQIRDTGMCVGVRKHRIEQCAKRLKAATIALQVVYSTSAQSTPFRCCGQGKPLRRSSAARHAPNSIQSSGPFTAKQQLSNQIKADAGSSACTQHGRTSSWS